MEGKPMSSMTLLTAAQEVGAQLGLDETQTSTRTLIDRWLDLSYLDIVGDYRWSWLQNRESISSETDYTTGTVSVNSGSSTLTFSATIAVSQANRYIQFSSANDWYKITAHTAGTDTATIERNYIQTSDLSAGTFTIRTIFYSLSSSVEYIKNVKEARLPGWVRIIDVNDLDRYDPFTESTGTTSSIVMWGQDSNGNWTFTPHPFPDDVFLLEFRTINKRTQLSADGDKPLFPDTLNSLWVDGAKSYGYEFNNDDRAKDAFIRFFARIQRAKKHDQRGLSKHTIIESIDRPSGIRNIVPFPAEYGDVRR
jgi:hypothetical protein